MKADSSSTSRRRALVFGSVSATLLPGCQFILTRFVEPPPPAPPPVVVAAPPPLPAPAPPPAPAPVPAPPPVAAPAQPPPVAVAPAASPGPLLGSNGTPSTYGFDSGAQMWVLQRGALKFHHYVTPEPGGRAASVIVEFADRLWVVDTLGAPEYGRELRYYANTLNKPIARVIFTHEHPDTWSGWGAFSEFPTFAPRETEAFLQTVLPTLPRREGVPAPKLAGLVAAGEERVGNVRVQIRIARDVESAAIVTLGFPEQNVWIASDMVYQKRHAYLGNRQLGRWSEQLNQLPEWVKTNALVLPGHGAPTDNRSIGQMRRYLLAAQEAMARLKTPAEIEGSLLSQFPDYGGPELLRVGIAHAQQRR